MMNTYEVLTLLILNNTFIVALLTNLRFVAYIR